MNARQHRFLVNMNRVLIFALTAGSLLMDGLQLADLTCTLALFLWLWLPLCTRLEADLLRRAGSSGSAGRPGPLPPHNRKGRTNHNSKPNLLGI